MKRILLSIPLVLLVLNVLNAESDQPPYAVNDVETHENFVDIYKQVSEHQHTGTDGSSGLENMSVSTLTAGNISASTLTVTQINITSATVANLGSFLGYKIKTFTANVATGNQSITGVGFKPRLVIFIYCIGDSADFLFSIGAAMGSEANSQFVFAALRGGDSGSGSKAMTNTYCLEVVNTSGAVTSRFQYVSSDADGFTINKLTTSGGAEEIGYIAFQ